MTGSSRMSTGLLSSTVTSKENKMELNTTGWYKKPQVLKGLQFLKHITATQKGYGETVVVDFGRTIELIDWRYLEADIDNPDPVLFVARGIGDNVSVGDITEWEFVQYKPNAEWKAIHMDPRCTEPISIYTFEKTYKHEIRANLRPVYMQYRNTFWYVMSVVPLFTDDGLIWDIYLKDRKYDSMVKVTANEKTTFGFSHLTNTFFFNTIEPKVKTVIDLEEIKQELKKDDVSEVIVAGVPMRFAGVREIAKGVLFFIFQDLEKEKRYYYARSTTKLRIITDVTQDTVEYRLDHIKAMHID